MYQYLALEFAKIGNVTYQERIWYVASIWKTCQIRHVFSDVLWMIAGAEFTNSGPLFSTLLLYDRLRSLIKQGPKYREEIRMFKTHFICGFLMIFSPREYSPFVNSWIERVFQICNLNLTHVMPVIEAVPVLPYPDMDLDHDLYSNLSRYFYNAIQYEIGDFPALPQCKDDWDYSEPYFVDLTKLNTEMMLDLYEYNKYRANAMASMPIGLRDSMRMQLERAPLGRDRLYWYNIVGTSKILQIVILTASQFQQNNFYNLKTQAHEDLKEWFFEKKPWISRVEMNRNYHVRRTPRVHDIMFGDLTPEQENYSDCIARILFTDDDDLHCDLYSDYLMWYSNSEYILSYSQWFHADENMVSENRDANFQFYENYFMDKFVFPGRISGMRTSVPKELMVFHHVSEQSRKVVIDETPITPYNRCDSSCTCDLCIGSRFQNMHAISCTCIRCRLEFDLYDDEDSDDEIEDQEMEEESEDEFCDICDIPLYACNHYHISPPSNSPLTSQNWPSLTEINEPVLPQSIVDVSNAPSGSPSESDTLEEFIDMREVSQLLSELNLNNIESIDPQTFSFTNIWELMQGRLPESYKNSLKQDFGDILKGAFDIVVDTLSEGAKKIGRSIVIVAIILWLLRTVFVKVQNIEITEHSFKDHTPRREKIMKYALIIMIAALSFDGGAILFERWKSMTLVSPQSSVVDFITVALSSLTFIKEWKSFATPKFIENLSKIGRSKQGLMEVLESMHLLFRQYLSPVFQKFGWYNPAITRLGISSVDDFFLQVDHIEQASRQGGLQLTYGNRRLVDGAIAISEQLLKTSKTLNLHKEVVSLIMMKVRMLVKHRDKFDEANIKPDNLRQESLGYYVYGEPNTMKTEFCVDFATVCVAMDCTNSYEREMFKTNPDLFIYIRTNLNEFWDKFSEVIKVVLYDDFQQAKDAEINLASEIMEVLRLINRHPFDTHQATLEKKGNVCAYNKFTILNGNRPVPNTDQVYSHNAIMRRLNFINVMVNRKYALNPNEPDHKKLKTNKTKLPKNHLNQTYIPLDFWDIYINRNDRVERKWEGPYNLEQLFYIVQEQYLEKRAHYEANVIQRQNMIQSSLEYFKESHWYNYMEASNNILHTITEKMVLKDCKGKDPADIKTTATDVRVLSDSLKAYEKIRQTAAEQFSKSEGLLSKLLETKYPKLVEEETLPQSGSDYESCEDTPRHSRYSLTRSEEICTESLESNFKARMLSEIFGEEEVVEDIPVLEIEGMEESYARMKQLWDNMTSEDKKQMKTKIAIWLDNHNFDKELFFWKKDGIKINSYLCVLSALYANNPDSLKDLINENLNTTEFFWGVKYDFSKHLSRFEIMKKTTCLPDWLISLTEFVIDGWTWIYNHPLISLIVTFGGIWAIGEFLLNDPMEPGYSAFPFTQSEFQESWWICNSMDNGSTVFRTLVPQPYDYNSLLHNWLLIAWDDPQTQPAWKDLSLANFEHEGFLPETPIYEEYKHHKSVVEKCQSVFPLPQSKHYEGPKHNIQKVKPKLAIKQLGKVLPQGSDPSGMQIFSSILASSSINLYRMDEVLGKPVAVFITHCFALTGRLVVIPYHMFARLKSVYRDGGLIPGTKFSFRKGDVMIYETTVENLIQRISSAPGPLVEHDLCGFMLPDGECFKNRIPYFLSYQDIANIDYPEVYVWVSNAQALESDVAEIKHNLEVTKNWKLAPGEKETYNIPTYLKYHIQTESGDCGVPVFLSKASACKNRILGFHAAGKYFSSLGYSSLIPRELIQEFADFYYKDQIMIVPSEKDIIDPLVTPQCQTNWNFIGRSPVYCHRLNKNHDIVPSPLQSLDAPEFIPTCAPAPLEPFDGISPLRLALQKHGENIISDTWTDEQRVCIDLALDSLKALIDSVPRKPRLLSWEEAIWGNPEHKYITAIKSSSSQGVRLKSFNSPVKDMLLGEGQPRDSTNLMFEAFVKKLEQIEEDAAKGIRWLWLYSINLKAEKLPLEKVLAGKARMFFGVDFEVVALIKKYFGAFVSEYFEGGIEMGHFTAGDPMSVDWNNLYRYLNSLTEDEILQLAAGDYSGFDTSHLRFVLWKIGCMINDWYDDGIRNRTIRMVLFMEIVAPRLILNSDIFEMLKGMCSGNVLTPVINNFWNHFIFRFVFYRATREHGYTLRFEDNMVVVVVGDDNVWTIRKFLRDIINEISVGKYMLELGCKYTSETKGESQFPFRNYTDVEFLKRKFRFDSEYQIMMAPIRWDTISEMILWTKKKDMAGIFVSNLYESVLESSLYGREVYENYCKFLRKELHRLKKYRKLFKFQSWSDAVNSIYLRTAEIRRLKNVEPQSNWQSQNLTFMTMQAQESDTIHAKEVEPNEVSTSQIDIVSFDDDQGIATAAPVESHALRLVAQPVSANDNSIIGFMERPLKIASGSFTNGVAEVLAPTFFPWFQLQIQSNMLLNKLKGVYGFKADMEFTLVCNSNKFVQGLYTLAWVPMGGAWGDGSVSSGVNWRKAHMYSQVQRSQLPHVNINLACDTKVQLSIPYMAKHDFYCLQSIDAYKHAWGCLIMWPACTESGYETWIRPDTSSANWSLYARFTNTQLVGASAIPQSRWVDQVLPQSNWKEQKSKNAGPVESIAIKASKTADVFSNVPVLGDYVKPIKWVADITAKTANIFGWSRPDNLSTPCQVKRRPFYGTNFVDDVDNSQKVALSSTNTVSVLPGFGSTDIDELDIVNFSKRKSFLKPIHWGTADAPGTLLQSMWNGPGYANFESLSALGTYHPSPLGFVASLFKFWRGSITYKVTFGKTTFHSGRLLITFCPYNGIDVTPPDSGYENFMYRHIVDLREQTEFTITIPFLSNTLWKECGGPCGSPAITDTITGRVDIYVLDKLVCPPNVPTDIYGIVEVFAGDDIQFAVPNTYDTYVPLIDNITPQSAWPDACEVVNDIMPGMNPSAPTIYGNQASIGESVSNLRTLLKRFTNLTPKVIGSAIPAKKVWSVVPGLIRANATDQNVFTPDLYSQLGCMFMFSRGSIRIKHIIPNNTSNYIGQYWLGSLQAANGVDYAQYEYAWPISDVQNGGAYGYQGYNRNLGFSHTKLEYGEEIEFPQYTNNHSRNSIEWLAPKGTSFVFRNGYDSAQTPALFIQSYPNTPKWQISVDSEFFMRAGGDDCNFGGFVSIPPCKLLGYVPNPA